MIESKYGVVEVKYNNIGQGFRAQFYEPDEDQDPVLTTLVVKK